MSRYIPEAIRKSVFKRANERCEYCRVYARHSYLSFHIEHIISLKHGGESILSNLALACPICNINKGTDIATFLKGIENPVRFFNPRKDDWSQHFSTESSGLIIPRTNIAAATLKIFDFNHPDSVIERMELLTKGIF